ncbi:MAG: hypothetical protein GXZ02_04955, partial [Clostridiales bacterium]|nr:hypothetical protein [Clostridiales bacterium]
MTDDNQHPRGLSREEVALRVMEGKTNEQPASSGQSTGRIICTNVFTYFNLIFFLIAAALLAVRSYNHMMFLPVILANTAIGIVQELR